MGSFSLFKIINQVLDTTQSAKGLTCLKGIRMSIPLQTLIQNSYTPKKTNSLNLKMAVSQSPFPRIYFSVNHSFFFSLQQCHKRSSNTCSHPDSPTHPTHPRTTPISRSYTRLLVKPLYISCWKRSFQTHPGAFFVKAKFLD